jgi:hypothetical protein
VVEVEEDLLPHPTTTTTTTLAVMEAAEATLDAVDQIKITGDETIDVTTDVVIDEIIGITTKALLKIGGGITLLIVMGLEILGALDSTLRKEILHLQHPKIRGKKQSTLLC